MVRLVSLEILDGLRRTSETILFGLQTQSIFQGCGPALGEQGITGYIREPVQLQQAVLGVPLRFKNGATPQMPRQDASFYHLRANQQKPVAVQRIFFRTHQNDILPLREPKKPIHRFLEIGRFTARRVIDQTVGAVIPRIQGTAAKLISEKLVDDYRGSQLRHKRFAIELRKAETAGAAAHIAHRSDFVAKEHPKELRQFQV